MEEAEWQYLAEGGANIVFKCTSNDHVYAHCVIRVAKAGSDDSRHVKPVLMEAASLTCPAVAARERPSR